MNTLVVSPLREAIADLWPGILQTWVRDAIEAYAQASLLMGHPGETDRLRRARLGQLQTRMLLPAYEALLDRYAQHIGEGRQLTLPWERHEDMLRRQWCDVAIGFVREPGRAQVQRWVLQASIGLASAVDRQTASAMLSGAAAEYNL